MWRTCKLHNIYEDREFGISGGQEFPPRSLHAFASSSSRRTSSCKMACASWPATRSASLMLPGTFGRCPDSCDRPQNGVMGRAAVQLLNDVRQFEPWHTPCWKPSQVWLHSLRLVCLSLEAMSTQSRSVSIPKRLKGRVSPQPLTALFCNCRSCWSPKTPKPTASWPPSATSSSSFRLHHAHTGPPEHVGLRV